MAQDIQAEVERRELSPRDLADMAGLSEGSVRGVRKPGWKPSLKTTLKCDEALFTGDPLPHQKRFMLPVDVGEVRRRAIAVDKQQRRAAYLNKIVMRPEAVAAIEPLQLGPAASYLRDRRNGDNLRETVAILKALAPNCATHLFVADGPPEDWFAEIWDRSTGYLGGQDLTGMRVNQNPDPLYVESMARDYLCAERTKLPQFCIIERSPRSDQRRSFIRFMQCLKDVDGVNKIIITTAPQPHGLYLDVVGDLMLRGPEQRQVVPSSFP